MDSSKSCVVVGPWADHDEGHHSDLINLLSDILHEVGDGCVVALKIEATTRDGVLRRYQADSRKSSMLESCG